MNSKPVGAFPCCLCLCTSFRECPMDKAEQCGMQAQSEGDINKAFLDMERSSLERLLHLDSPTAGAAPQMWVISRPSAHPVAIAA